MLSSQHDKTSRTTKWTSPVAVVVIPLLPFLLFGGYMGAYYLAMPSNYLERWLWKVDIERRAESGDTPLFGPALTIEDWLDGHQGDESLP